MIGELAGLIGYGLGHLERRKGIRTAKHRCPRCLFVIICDKKRALAASVSPLWKVCTWGKYRQELINKETTDESN